MAAVHMMLNVDNIRWSGLFPHRSIAQDLLQFEPLHRDRDILITGAGGSIGSALSKAIFGLKPRTLILLDTSEQNLYTIHRNLAMLGEATDIVPVLGSVADVVCTRDVFARFRPRLVYHAAALKHVPLGEMNPFAVVQNNVFGSTVVAAVAREYSVERLIMISTDKSVNSQSIMGASKRLAEIALLGGCGAQTRMTSIRLGNVLGSEGSVVPLFLEQIARGGPVTVTDPDVERYFLTMEETVARVLAAAASCPKQPAIAVPVIQTPVKIADLARYLIAQASAPKLTITFTGLRPGDKLHEEFIAANEAVMCETTDGLQWLRSPGLSAAELADGLAELESATKQHDLAGLLTVLTRLVPEYQPSAHLLEQAATEVWR